MDLNVSRWKLEIERLRQEKDRFFAESFESPIPPEDRPRFTGLDYFPPDPEYRFELELLEHAERTWVKIAYSGGEVKEFLRRGEFRFRVEGKEVVLQAYQANPQEDTLFVPFRDATCGKETYGAGRYLDLHPGRHLLGHGKWVLDFNLAYNPWCAYSEAYTCPFIPTENWLEVAILAGEKNYPLAHGDESSH